MEPIFSTEIGTPIGKMIACAHHSKICMFQFADRATIQQEMDEVSRYINAEIVFGEIPIFDELRQQLKEYFSGNRKEFTIPIEAVGTDFQKKTWQSLREISYGTTETYLQQAVRLGNPKSVRAVASANGRNKIPILIPCHRVIGTNGKLTGYSGGIWRKQKLLELENITLL